MDSREYETRLIEDGFIEYDGWKTTLTNSGFRNTRPYNLPEDWISHESLCTICEVLINYPAHLLQDLDHGEQEWMVRAAAHGCFYCTRLLKMLSDTYNYKWDPMNLPLRLAGAHHKICTRAYRREFGAQSCLEKIPLEGMENEHELKSRATHRFGNTSELRAQINSWLTTCDTEHEACRTLAKGIPRRLLIVDNSRDRWRVRLIEPKDPVRYVTLSYCWGKHQPVRLLRQTLDQFKKSIRIETLPKTLRDTIYTTRQLGFQYLWIDSLCIIQDDPADIEHEVLNMHSIYNGSTLNMVADSASDCDGGLFAGEIPTTNVAAITVEPRVFKDEPYKFVQKHTVYAVYVAVDSAWVWRTLGLGATARRAWCIQERMLAPRLVHFTETQALWQCKSIVACELFPQGRPWASLPGEFGLRQPFTLHPSDGQAGSIDRIIADLLQAKLRSAYWDTFIQYYTLSHLTHIEDRYAAMAGIVGSILDKHPELSRCYVAGTWHQHLPLSLAWQIRRSNSRVMPLDRKPTWSWIVVESAVTMVDKADYLHAEFIAAEIYGAGPLGILRPSAGVVCIYAPSFAVVRDPQEQTLWNATCEQCGCELLLYRSGFTPDAILDRDPSPIPSFLLWDWADWNDYQLQTRMFTLVPIASGGNNLWCLMLVEASTDKAVNSYERRGHMTLFDLKRYGSENIWKGELSCLFHKRFIEIW